MCTNGEEVQGCVAKTALFLGVVVAIGPRELPKGALRAHQIERYVAEEVQ